MSGPRLLPLAITVFAALTAQAAAGAAGAAASSVDTKKLLAGTGRATIDPPPAQFPIRNNNDSPLIAIHYPDAQP